MCRNVTFYKFNFSYSMDYKHVLKMIHFLANEQIQWTTNQIKSKRLQWEKLKELRLTTWLEKVSGNLIWNIQNN